MGAACLPNHGGEYLAFVQTESCPAARQAFPARKQPNGDEHRGGAREPAERRDTACPDPARLAVSGRSRILRAVVSAAPVYAALARRELDTVLPIGSSLEELSAGVWLLSTRGSFADRTAELSRTVFVRHCCPVSAEVPFAADSPATLAAALLPAALGCLRGVCCVQVQVRILPASRTLSPGPLAAHLRAALNGAGVHAVGGPADLALSLVITDNLAFLGCSPVKQNLSPWPGGEARLRRDPAEISRAARKLEEAMILFRVEAPPGGRAVDLGAAPGGYTAFLLARGLQVVAVDTGQLSSGLVGKPGLTFLRGPAHGIPLPVGPFDLLTADLSWDPLRAVECALRFRPLLTSGAHGIFTIKFFGGDPLNIVARARRRLEAGYRVLAVRHLFHDRDEATAHLRA